MWLHVGVGRGLVGDAAEGDLRTIIYMTSSVWATFPIFYGTCMEEHT